MSDNHETNEGGSKGQMLVLAFLGLIAIIFGINIVSGKGEGKDHSPSTHVTESSISYANVDELKKSLKDEIEKSSVIGHELMKSKAKVDQLELSLKYKERQIQEYKLKLLNIKSLINADQRITKTEESLSIPVGNP